jgi:hypothetical protein
LFSIIDFGTIFVLIEVTNGSSVECVSNQHICW